METADSIDGDPSAVSAGVMELLAEKVPADLVDVVGDFAHLYMRRVHEGPLLELDDDALASHLSGVFSFANDRGLNPVAVRVFNPSDDDDGYSARGTVVEISIADRPFLVDSVTGEIQAHNVRVEHVAHPVFGTNRDDDGDLIAVTPARDAASRESLQHYQLDRLLGIKEREQLHDDIARTLGDVRRVVEDFDALKGSILRMIDLARAGTSRYGERRGSRN